MEDGILNSDGASRHFSCNCYDTFTKVADFRWDKEENIQPKICEFMVFMKEPNDRKVSDRDAKFIIAHR